MNNVTLIGRLTKDPEVRYTSSQMAVARFTIAVDRSFKKEGEPTADFIPIVAFGKTAENCERFLSRGKQVGVEGRIQTGSYDKQDGTRAYTTDVIANRVEFIGSGGKNDENAKQGGSDSIPTGFSSVSEEDIPF